MTNREQQELIGKIKAASRIPVTIHVSAVTLIRALVWGVSRDGRSAEKMMSAIVADRAGNRDNMREALSGATLQASLVGVPAPDWIRAVIRQSEVRAEGIDLALLPDEVLYSLFGVGEIDLSGLEMPPED